MPLESSLELLYSEFVEGMPYIKGIPSYNSDNWQCYEGEVSHRIVSPFLLQSAIHLIFKLLLPLLTVAPFFFWYNILDMELILPEIPMHLFPLVHSPLFLTRHSIHGDENQGYQKKFLLSLVLISFLV